MVPCGQASRGARLVDSRGSGLEDCLHGCIKTHTILEDIADPFRIEELGKDVLDFDLYLALRHSDHEYTLAGGHRQLAA
jgi:hypothetical protein